MRDFELYPDHITLYTLKPFKNHTRKQYRRKYAGSFYVDNELVKRIIAWLWMCFGIGGKA